MANSPERWWTAQWLTAWIGAAAAVAGVVLTVVAMTKDDPDKAAPPTQTLFMYGTMKPGHYFYPDIDQYVAETIPATVTGKLYDSGSGYPVAVFGGQRSSKVQGYVLKLIPETATQANAVISGVENNLFRPVRIKTDDGLSAVAYEWVGDTSTLTEVPDGNWTTATELQPPT